MIQVYDHLYVGGQTDYELNVSHQAGWRVVHACKEPYHRQALGYTGRGAPKTHPEYLVARRANRLILNLVDADRPEFFAASIFDAAVEFIHAGLSTGENVLVHCNQGESRGPGVAMIYLAVKTDALPADYAVAEIEFRRRYPPFNPSLGMRGFLMANWARYAGQSAK